jgi:hypothetical protein
MGSPPSFNPPFSHAVHVPMQGFFHFVHLKDGCDDLLEADEGGFTFDDIVVGVVVHAVDGHLNLVLGGKHDDRGGHC